MGLTSVLNLSLVSTLTNPLDLGTPASLLSYSKSLSLASGTGANQANQIFHDQRTLDASASEDLDLSGSLTNAFGASVVFTKLKAIIIFAAAANTNNVLVGGASATQVASIFSAVNDVLVIRPGGLFVLTAPDLTGMAVAGGTADLLKIANSSSGTAVTYDIVLIGVV